MRKGAACSLVYWIVVACGVAGLYLLSYEGVLAFIRASINKELPVGFVQRYFPEKLFVTARWTGMGLLMLTATGIYLFRRPLTTALVRLVQSGRVEAVRMRRRISADLRAAGKAAYLLGLIPLGILAFQVYQAWTRPFQYDEAWSFNYHIGNDFAASFLLPNNHFLYTIVAHFFNKLPLPTEFALRLPLILAGLVSFICLYHLLRSFYGRATSWLVAVFFYSSCAVTFYTFFARAYMFELLFLVLFLIASQKWVTSRAANNTALYALLLFFVLGMYSMPTSLYFFLPAFGVLAAMAWGLNKRGLGALVAGGLLAGLVLFVLFLPLFFSSHAGNLLAAGTGSSTLSFSFVHAYLVANEYFHFGTERLGGALYLAACLGLGAFLVRGAHARKYVLAVSLAVLLSGVVFLMVQGIMLKDRFMIHLLIGFCFFAAELLQRVQRAWAGVPVRRLSYALFWVSAAVVATNLVVAAHHYYLNWSNGIDRSLRKVSAVMKQDGIDSVYLFSPYAKPAIEYYYKTAGRPVVISLPLPNSIDYTPFDSAAKYESVLFDSDNPVELPRDTYRVKYKDDYYTLVVSRP